MGLNFPPHRGKAFSPGCCHQPGLKGGISPGWWLKPGLIHPFSPGCCHQPGLKALLRCGGKFSPTSLVERGQHQFISCAASLLSNSFELQAYGPKSTVQCLWAYWACCGPESWPMVGFLVVFTPCWPSRWHFFSFFLFIFSFLLRTKYL